MMIVGVALLPKKFKKHGFENTSACTYHLLTPSQLTSEHLLSLNVDILLHKLSDWRLNLEELEGIREELERWGGRVIGALDVVGMLGSRGDTCLFLNKLCERADAEEDWRGKIKLPQTEIHLPNDSPNSSSSSSTTKIISVNNESNTVTLSYPLIKKPQSACSLKESHTMALYLRPPLHTHSPPFIVQKFVEHHAWLYKVYVVGDFVSIDVRSSLSAKDYYSQCSRSDCVGCDDEADRECDDFHCVCGNRHKSNPHIIHFDSQTLKQPISRYDHIEAMSRIDIDLIKSFTQALQRSLGGLELFGWDLIVGEGPDEEAGQYWIIDVNYFPGYVGVDFLGELELFLLSAR